MSRVLVIAGSRVSVIAGKLHRSRGAKRARGLFRGPRFSKARGDGAPIGAAVLLLSRVLSDTWRPSARRLDVFRRRPRFRRAPSMAHAPSASSWRGGPSAPRAEPGAARGRRPNPHE